MAKKSSKVIRIEEELTEQQERFCIEFLKDFNGKQAALRCGYKSRSSGSYLLTLPQVIDRINQLKEEARVKGLVSVEFVVKGLLEVFDRCLAKKPKMEWNPKVRRMEQAEDECGRLLWSFDSSGACKSLQMLGQYVGLFDSINNLKNSELNKRPQLTEDQFNKLLETALKASVQDPAKNNGTIG